MTVISWVRTDDKAKGGHMDGCREACLDVVSLRSVGSAKHSGRCEAVGSRLTAEASYRRSAGKIGEDQRQTTCSEMAHKGLAHHAEGAKHNGRHGWLQGYLRGRCWG